MKFETDLPSGIIKIGDKEWNLKGEPFNLGRFLPNYYSVLLTNTDLDDSTLEKDIMVTSESKDNVLNIKKDAFMVSLLQENRDSLLIIDGKETGKKVSAYEVFDFINHKGDLTHYKREKTYLLMQDDNGNYEFIISQ